MSSVDTYNTIDTGILLQNWEKGMVVRRDIVQSSHHVMQMKG